jgi:hypothetical protein
MGGKLTVYAAVNQVRNLSRIRKKETKFHGLLAKWVPPHNNASPKAPNTPF